MGRLAVVAAVLVRDGEGDRLPRACIEGAVLGDRFRHPAVRRDHDRGVRHPSMDREQSAHPPGELLRVRPGRIGNIFGSSGRESVAQRGPFERLRQLLSCFDGRSTRRSASVTSVTFRPPGRRVTDRRPPPRSIGHDLRATIASSSSTDHWSAACAPYFTATTSPALLMRKSAGRPSSPPVGDSGGSRRVRIAVATAPTTARNTVRHAPSSATAERSTPNRRYRSLCGSAITTSGSLALVAEHLLLRRMEDDDLLHARGLDLRQAQHDLAQMHVVDHAASEPAQLQVHVSGRRRNQ